MHGIGLDSVGLEEHLSRDLGFALFRLLLGFHSRVESQDNANDRVAQEVCNSY